MSITLLLFFKEEGIQGEACDHDFVTRKEARTTVDLCSEVTAHKSSQSRYRVEVVFGSWAHFRSQDAK